MTSHHRFSNFNSTTDLNTFPTSLPGFLSSALPFKWSMRGREGDTLRKRGWHFSNRFWLTTQDESKQWLSGCEQKELRDWSFKKARENDSKWYPSFDTITYTTGIIGAFIEACGGQHRRQEKLLLAPPWHSFFRKGLLLLAIERHKWTPGYRIFTFGSIIEVEIAYTNKLIMTRWQEKRENFAWEHWVW